MAKKKVVMILLEGPSDATALGKYFKDFFSGDRVVTKILHTDITSQKGVYPDTIKAKVGCKINDELHRLKLNKSDLMRVIHVVDLDGAFIPDIAIKLDETKTTFIYKDDGIHYKDVNAVVNRNTQKKQNIETLYKNTSGICGGVMYHIYYMSCNLEHVLHNLRQVAAEDKEGLAYEFGARYKDDLPGFLKYMKESEFSVCSNYLESWDFITKDLRSLQRYTNIGLCLKKLAPSPIVL